MTQLDALIVGQGLAGTLLGLSLLDKGQRIMIVDNGHKSSSTKVAAGMMNPVMGQRLTRLFSTVDDATYVEQFYRDIEAKLKVDLLETHQLLRCLSQPRELEYVQIRRQNPAYQSTLQVVPNLEDFEQFVDVGKDQFLIPKVMRLNTVRVLSESKSYFESIGCLVQDQFVVDDALIKEDVVAWKGVTAKRLYFCEGYKSAENPLFDYLDFENAHGDFLDVSCDALPENTIFNQGKWLCPVGKGRYSYGTLSYWQDSPEDQQNAVRELEQSLANFIKVPYTITGHQHGVRPVLKQRKAMLAQHPQHKVVWVITGLGGQGCSRMPLLLREK